VPVRTTRVNTTKPIMKLPCTGLHVLLWVIAPSIACAGEAAAQSPDQAPGPRAEEKQKKIAGTRKMRDETLAQIFKEKPELEEEITKAVGYVVFGAS
jgi:hypothetical protein